MNSGFRSRFVDDALTRRQLDVERLKTALQREHGPVMQAVHAALMFEVSGLSTTTIGNISRLELRRMVRVVLSKFDLEHKAFASRVTDWLEEYTNQEAAFTHAVVDEATTEELPVLPLVWPTVAGGIVGASGMTIAQMLTDLGGSQKSRIRQMLQRAYAQRWSASQLQRAFRGNVTQNFRNGLMHKLGQYSSNVLHTAVQFSQSAARNRVFETMADITIGYNWVSILDGATSDRCRSLSGRFFKFGGGPIPPLHYRCRSHISPVFRKSALTQTAAGVVADAGETYYNWLARQTRAFQNEVLGSTRAKLFRNGGLSSDEFAAKVLNTRYEPLTLDELRKRAPSLFKNAGL